MKTKKTKIVILEGVTTTGKTTIFNNLKRFSEENGLNWVFISEEQTIIPIIDSQDKEYINAHFLKLFKKYVSKKGVYIFDRLHLSSFFKTQATIEDFRVIENKLLEFDTYIFMLHVCGNKLKERIIESMGYRNIGWSKYVLKKVGGKKIDVAKLYIKRQDEILKILKESALKNKVMDTYSQDFVTPTRQIIDELGFKIRV